ncbi:MAG: HlyD family secretion protein [Lysobacterales bacterium 14-68-21]|jgi:membrane fusion protein|nr:MAG: HlyD family secretion protein [Xanthomonadales bacterium 15-68-25]OZB68247.1 MAG: HlyD family secretion protein [Xanthomonadales bacterium 14-68-21]
MFGGHYTRHEEVHGTLVPDRGLLTLTPVTSGIVARVLVREGDQVQAGQPLVDISGEQVSASLGDTDASITAQLEIKRDRLRSDLANGQHLGVLQGADLRSQLKMLNEQIAREEQQVRLQQQRAESAMALYDQWMQVGGTGVVSKLQLLQQHDLALQNRAQLESLKGQVFDLRRQEEQLQGKLDQLPSTVAAKRNDIERKLADVEQSLAQSAARRAVVLRAPAAGTVATVLVHPGQTVAAQQSLMMVLPAHAQLLAELWVPARAMGFIRKGQAVGIRYRAYPYQKFGQYVGRVSEVSRSAVMASDVSRLVGEQILEPRYRVEVSLDSQSVFAYGKSELLRPGMTLDADVLLDRRRLIEWVLEPIQGFKRDLNDHAEITNTAGEP